MAAINQELMGRFLLAITFVFWVGLMVYFIYSFFGGNAAPSPVFEPEHVVARGWQSWVSEPDAITGVESRLVVTRGVMVGGDSRVSQYNDDPTLILRCESNEFDIIVHWGGRYVADNISWYLVPRIPTVLRFDDESPINASSAESADNRFMFLKKSNKFVERLSDAGRMTVRITNFDDDRMTAQFAVVGLAEHWDDLPCVR